MYIKEHPFKHVLVHSSICLEHISRDLIHYNVCISAATGNTVIPYQSRFWAGGAMGFVNCACAARLPY
jgi:hypothetical protein